MPIDLIINLLQSLTGSTFLQDKVKRSEHVIRVLKQLGLDPDHPPEDFEGVYNYALVEYGIGKPEVCLQIFREREIRVLFRSDSQDVSSAEAKYMLVSCSAFVSYLIELAQEAGIEMN